METQDPSLSLRAEALLSQSDWVRALVRGLGVRESDAEDVVQSTWVAALTSPPRAGEGPGLRAWVARVARNFAIARVTGDRRRSSRERESAREERLPSAADVVEREEARARIVQAILDVDEPYRTTLLLRYYEGLEPRDIARRQNVPGSTVRNRLKRGLACLRERLEASEGAGWRQRCLLVLPALRLAPQPPGWLPKWVGASASTGGAVAIKVFGVAAAVAFAAGGWTIVRQLSAPERDLLAAGVFERGAESAGGSASPSVPGPSTDDAAGLTPLDSGRGSGARESASAAPDSSAPVDDGVRCVLGGTLRSPDGAPIQPTELPFLGRLSGGIARKRADFQLADMQASLPSGMEVKLRTRGIDLAVASGSEEADPHAEESASIATGMGGVPVGEVEIHDRSSLSAVFERVSFGVGVGAAPRQRGRVVIASSTGDAREVEVDDQGNFTFGDLLAGSWHLYATAPGWAARRMDFEIGRGEKEKHLDVSFSPLQPLRVKMVTPEGRDLLDAAAEDASLAHAFVPVPFATRESPGSRITDLGEDPGRLYGAASWRNRAEIDEKTASDASGVLLLHESPPLHVGISVRGAVLEERLVPSGAEEVVFVVALDRVRGLVSALSVRIVSAQDGLPVANATVLIPDGGATSTDDRGIAELDGLPPGRRRIEIEAEGFEHRSEWIEIEPGVKNDLGVRELGAAVAIAGRLVDENGDPVVAGVEIRALPEPGQAISSAHELPIVDATETDAEGRFRFEKPGSRRYLLLVYGDDWAASATIVDPREKSSSELVVEARRNGELKMTFPVEPGPESVYVVETGHGIPVAVQACEGWKPLSVRLGVGDYRVRLADSARTLWVRHVIVDPERMIAFDERRPGAKPGQD